MKKIKEEVNELTEKKIKELKSINETILYDHFDANYELAYDNLCQFLIENEYMDVLSKWTGEVKKGL